MKLKDESLRRYFSLWWKYLTLSTPYKELCEAIDEFQKALPLPQNFQNYNPGNTQDFYMWRKWLGNIKEQYDTERWQREFSRMIVYTYPLFQNVFNDDFELFFIRAKKYLDTIDVTEDGPSVWGAEEDLHELLTDYNNFLVEELGRKATVEEFIDRFVHNMQNLTANLKPLVCVNINAKKTRIDYDFQKWLQKQRENVFLAMNNPNSLLKTLQTMRDSHLITLREYIEIYIKTNDLNLTEYIKERFPEDKVGSGRTDLMRNRRYVKRIVSNAELFVFPGKYSDEYKDKYDEGGRIKSSLKIIW